MTRNIYINRFVILIYNIYAYFIDVLGVQQNDVRLYYNNYGLLLWEYFYICINILLDGVSIIDFN